MGSIFHVPVGRLTHDAFASWRKSWPGLVIGTHLDGAIDFRKIAPANRPVLLLMGNEQQGLPEALVAMCDHLCLIPMAGKADSLNLAAATGIMAFELRRHHLKIATDSGAGQ
jgi:TrmH family RNA methyltransferase